MEPYCLCNFGLTPCMLWIWFACWIQFWGHFSIRIGVQCSTKYESAMDVPCWVACLSGRKKTRHCLKWGAKDPDDIKCEMQYCLYTVFWILQTGYEEGRLKIHIQKCDSKRRQTPVKPLPQHVSTKQGVNGAKTQKVSDHHRLPPIG